MQEPSKKLKPFRFLNLSPPKNPYLLNENTLISTQPTSKYNKSLSKITRKSDEDSPLIFNEMKKFLEKKNIKKKPFIFITESDILKEKEKRDRNGYFYKPVYGKDYSKDNKYFQEDFLDYLNGKIEISEFINRNNFPHENEKRNNSCNSLDFLRKSRENSMMKNNKNSVKYENNIKNANTINAFSGLRNIIKEKIQERKKNKVSNIRNFQLFKQFSNISDDYIKKIQNCDLMSENFNKKYYMKDISTERSLGSCRLIKEKKPEVPNQKLINGIRQLKEDNKVYEISLKYEMKKEVDLFLSNLQKSRDLERLVKRKILQKILKRDYKSKISQSSPHNSNTIKRRVLTNYDIALCEYLLHSKLIEECQKNNNRDIHLKENFEASRPINNRRNSYYEGLLTANNENIKKTPKKIEVPTKVIPSSLNNNSKYFEIKRNSLINLSNSQISEYGDDSLISNTEVALDQMYRKSRELQINMLKKPNLHFSKKLKEVMKLDELNEKILKTSKKKLE